MAGSLGGLNIELNADIAKFANAMEKSAYLAEKTGKQMEAAFQSANAHVKVLEAGIKGLGTSLGALGVIGGIGAFAGMIKSSIETAAEFKRLSESTGVSVSALSAMSATAKVVGMDMNAVGLMISKLDKAMWAAQGGNKAAIASFKNIGVAAMDTNGNLRSSEDVMMDVAKKMAEMDSGAARTGLAMELFGKKGAQMIPFLLELAEKGDLNGKITDKQAESAERLEKAWIKFQKSMNSWKYSAMETLGPALERLIPIFPYLIEGAIAFIGVVKLLPMAINGVTATIRIMATSFGLAGVTGAGVFATLTAAVRGFTAALAANPFTALLIAITAAASALYLFQDKLVTFGNTTASIGNWIGAVWEKAGNLLKGIWSSVSSFVMPIVDATIRGIDAVDKFLGKGSVKIGAPTVGADPNSIAAIAAAKQVADDAAAKAAEKNSKYSPINTGNGETYKTDPFAKALSDVAGQKDGLQWGLDHWKEYANGIESSKEAMARFEVELGKFSDTQRRAENRAALTSSQKQQYIDAGMALDELTQKKKSYDDLIKFNNDTAKQAEDYKAKLAFAQQEIDLRGKGTLEAQNLTIQYAEQLKLQERINTLLKDTKLSEQDRADAIAKAMAGSQGYVGGLQGINTERYNNDRSAGMGFKEGFNSITENATNSAKQIESVMAGAFNSASDALAKFCSTGKINFSQLGTAIIDMMLKVASQQFFGNLMALAGGGIGSGGTGGMFGAIGSMFGMKANASGGGLATGQLSLVGENGPELFMPNSSGTVVPNHQVRQAISGASSANGSQFNGDVNVVVNSNGQTTTTGQGGSMSDLGAQIGSIVQQHLMTQMRPGGLLAA